MRAPRSAGGRRPLAVFETSLPPRWYIPPDDLRADLLEESEAVTRCPYEGPPVSLRGVTLVDQAARARATSGSLGTPPDLRPVVSETWVQAYTDAIRSESRPWRVVPDLQPHLIVHRHLDGRTRGPRVVGARSTWLDTRVRTRAWSVGVSLRPGTLPALARLAAEELVDRSAGAIEVWGRRGAVLDDATAEARSPEEAAGFLHAFLREGLEDPGRAVDWRVRGFATLAAGPGKRSVRDLAAELGVSPRTLRAVWRREVGLSPREALSIDRLHRAVGLALLGAAPITWATVARASGFYDQPHMIRDFRRFLGETPERFLARGASAAR